MLCTVRQVLEHMYEEYDKAVEAHEAKVADGGGQACTEHPPELLALKRRIDMYDNEYMVKVTAALRRKARKSASVNGVC